MSDQGTERLEAALHPGGMEAVSDQGTERHEAALHPGGEVERSGVLNATHAGL